MAVVSQSFTANSQSSATLTPRVGRGFNISLSGTFVATVGLYRQLPGDSTSTWRLVQSWTGPVETSMTDYENGVSFQLQTSSYTSGTAVGRLGQSL